MEGTGVMRADEQGRHKISVQCGECSIPCQGVRKQRMHDSTMIPIGEQAALQRCVAACYPAPDERRVSAPDVPK